MNSMKDAILGKLLGKPEFGDTEDYVIEFAGEKFDVVLVPPPALWLERVTKEMKDGKIPSRRYTTYLLCKCLYAPEEGEGGLPAKGADGKMIPAEPLFDAKQAKHVGYLEDEDAHSLTGWYMTFQKHLAAWLVEISTVGKSQGATSTTPQTPGGTADAA